MYTRKIASNFIVINKIIIWYNWSSFYKQQHKDELYNQNKKMGCLPPKSNLGAKTNKNTNDIDQCARTKHFTENSAIGTTASAGDKIPRRFSGRWNLQEYAGVRQRYKMMDVVGHGRFGVVYKAECKFEPGKLVAIKVLKNNSYLDKKAITEEIKILRHLDHPNIAKYYEEIEAGPYIFIVTEYCSGGEVFERLAAKELFKESEAAAIIEKLLCALNHCHSKNIAHRDIKPENILYTSKDEHAEVKLIDFGLAKQSDKYAKTYETIVGTPYYVAPEVIDGNYTCSCDIWSLGIVLHVMLSGMMPFSGDHTEDIFRSIKKGNLTFDHPVWQKVTPPAKDLLQKLLEPDETKRLTAGEALKHEWFNIVKTYSPEIDQLDDGNMKCMRKYQKTSKFQKVCMNIFVKNLKQEEINHLIEVFNHLDKERNGYIDANDLIMVYKKYHPAADVKEMLEELDLEGNGLINYSQFIASAIDVKQFLTRERLWALFEHFDIANQGYLTAEDIKEVLNQSGQQHYTTEDIIAMLKEHKIKYTDKIEFAQFADIMGKMKFSPEEDVLQKVVVQHLRFSYQTIIASFVISLYSYMYLLIYVLSLVMSIKGWLYIYWAHSHQLPRDPLEQIVHIFFRQPYFILCLVPVSVSP
eukprot:TRINITY_DN121100_c0_g1_i1.p1 TRINITY_DN121100_c0_g1~~TRINITY_DN121100_c0_g1_i1.p1  ORF type:complete len:638 (-),score=69.91 TRINITY_DN121100_c0_g1_i1:2465-4378(-)